MIWLFVIGFVIFSAFKLIGFIGDMRRIDEDSKAEVDKVWRQIERDLNKKERAEARAVRQPDQGPLPNKTAQEVDATAKAARISRIGDAPRAKLHEPGRVNADGEPWRPREEWISTIDNAAIPQSGQWARFEYADRDGVITERHIRKWSKRGAYIEGFCMERRESRTFRQDRVNNWTCG